MKKVFVLVLVILSIYGIYKINNKKTIPVSNVTNFKIDDYNVFYLDLSESNITTRNIKKFIPKSVDIISLTPYVNPIYKNKIGDLKYKFMNNLSLNKNINNFINYYKDTIKSNNYIDDINYIDVEGIKILELEVYAKGIDIIDIIYNDSKIRYKTVFNGEYNYLGI